MNVAIGLGIIIYEHKAKLHPQQPRTPKIERGTLELLKIEEHTWVCGENFNLGLKVIQI